MPAEGEAKRPRLPLFDRLSDPDPGSAIDPVPSAAATMSALRASLRSDLEALLNSRRRWRSWDRSLGELACSPIGFGMPDFAGGAFNDKRAREELRAEVEAVIRRFEPRLATLGVSLLEQDDRLSATLRLRIEGLLQADPAPEPISFETLVDSRTTDITVLADPG